MSDEPIISLSEGTKPESDERPVTERGKSKAREDAEFLPVIVKRIDEARRHPDDTLEIAIKEGYEQLRRPLLSLALSSIAAGLILGFSAMAVAVVTTTMANFGLPMLTRILTAMAYPLGFVVCIKSGTELFTEHTATAVYPVLDQRASVWSLLRLWVVVLAGNLIGTAGSAFLLTLAETVIGAREGYIEIGRHLVEFGSLPLLVSSTLAGWLMALGAWLICATPPNVSPISSVYIVTFLIGLGGLHHSIAGSAEMFTALSLSTDFTIGEVVRFIGLAVIGNLIGGSLFVAALNYGHIRQSQRIDE